MAPRSKPFRILALDGGGVKGAFSAAVLEEFERYTKHKVIDHFDLIVGTSTGGILAIALGLGVSPRSLVELYTDEAELIFGGAEIKDRMWRTVRHIFGPKHSHNGLAAALERRFRGRRLGHSKVRLVIPTFDGLKGRACAFKTYHHERLTDGYQLPAVEVACATAAAPTYFSAARISSRRGSSYLDGGVWANSPTMVGIVEAVHFLGVDLKDIDMLSIGTTEEYLDFSQKADDGVAGWNKGLVEVMMAAQVNAAQAQARLLLGDKLHRVNFQANAKAFALDDCRAETLEKLAGLGADVARKATHRQAVKSRFLNGDPAEPFVPVAKAPSPLRRRRAPTDRAKAKRA